MLRTVLPLIASLRRIAAWRPDTLLPAHGPAITNPPAAIDKLIARIQAVFRSYYSIDALRCVRCGGRLAFISVILDTTVAHDILVSLGLPADKPRVARARSPTLFEDLPSATDVA